MSNQGDGNPPENNGGNQGETESQWSGGAQPWSGDQAGQPSWSTGQTGPNVGPTMNNPQSSYYDRFAQASGEGVVVTPKKPGGNRGKLLIGTAAALVVVIAAVAIFALTRNSDKAPTPAASSAATSSLPPVTATTWVNPTLAAGVRPLKDGWQSQPGHGVFGVYDVPKTKDWKVESDSMTRFYEDSKGNILAGMGATSTYGVGFCDAKKDQWLAVVGMRGGGKSDPTQLGADEAQKFADAISTSSHHTPGTAGKLSAAKQLKVDQGTIPAVEYTITATAGDPTKCDKGKKYEVRTVTFSVQGTTYQFVTIRLLGVGKELPESTLNDVISTFRTRG
ncbi:hypothetical protein [Flexivirga oryzae]|uniref:DUF8017 domain-containing protein n=1 Tax=Flexivirga oryzae TaxID=1794944 RepID=A0A839NE37_9MICO|nr:hypothetical protein [Flexivirga oryzae]MBB2892951.1 hypothetical protein [Flexivirga oryzae]